MEGPAARPRGRRSHNENFRRLIEVQAQYVYDTFGKWPATVPSVFVLMYLQTHHLDLEYYDELFEPGAYLKSHAEHFARWSESTPAQESQCRSAPWPRSCV